MPDGIDITGLPFGWLLVVIIVVIVVAAFGMLGYVIASRRVKQPLVRFLARYAISFSLLFLLEYAFLSLLPSFHESIRSFVATVTGGLLGLAGVSHSVSGSIIVLQDPYLAFNIDVACLGGILFWVYAALVLAEHNATLKQRVVGIFAGFIILLGFNLFRITMSIYLEWLTGVHVHDYFYVFNMAFVLLVWAGWLKILKSKRLDPSPIP
jgi:exosortase/archaeosortase family protein